MFSGRFSIAHEGEVRKRPEIELNGCYASRERVWAAALKVGRDGRRFTVLDVQDATAPRVRFATVDLYLRRLRHAGHLRVVQPSTVQPGHGSRRSPVVFELAQSVGNAQRIGSSGGPVNQGLGNLAMWRAMRILKSFDFRDIANAATQGSVQVSETTARKYVDHLNRAGYLQLLCGPMRRQPARYRLSMNTGPLPPAITRTKAVIDRNLNPADLPT